MTLENLFRSRPFKTRNADEYDIENILTLFVSPTTGLNSPFDYENIIVKGRMGSGKTMYLRANHACHLLELIPSLIENNSDIILPVFIKLSDFQHITEPSKIYYAVVLKIVEEIISIYSYLEDAKHLANLHMGMKVLVSDPLQKSKVSSSLRRLALLGSDEYIRSVSSELGLNGGVKPKFFEASAEWKKTNFEELKGKENPGIKDIEDCYKSLLENQNGKILLLIDEAGSLDASFFKSGDSSQSTFEILMNQFRTSSFIRTKIAVYPNSYSDMLTETRYGDFVTLEDCVTNDLGYKKYRERVLHIIDNYLNPDDYITERIDLKLVFDVQDGEAFGDSVEQIMFASNGNTRRLI